MAGFIAGIANPLQQLFANDLGLGLGLVGGGGPGNNGPMDPLNMMMGGFGSGLDDFGGIG